MGAVGPARPGDRLVDVDTPALLIDLDAFEANLDHMAGLLAGTGVRLRAHAKTHKSPVIAHLQMARGAVGQCVQKVGEAEALAWAGVPDILVSNEVVGEAKLARLAALARICRIAVCCDDLAQVAPLDSAAAQAGVRLTVLIEIDVGAERCGTAAGEPAVRLARAIAASGHLMFGGLQAYRGTAQHLRTLAARQDAVAEAAEAVRRTLDGLRAVSLPCPVVGGAGTGTFQLEAATGLFTELQAGSYVFMDSDYARNQSPPPFAQSLFVLATVMSASRPGVAVLDVGLKAISIESGPPLVVDAPGWRYVSASDEHGTLAADPGAAPLRLGDKIRLTPSHCDPTVDRHDWYVGLRGERVECLWPITARGAFS